MMVDGEAEIDMASLDPKRYGPWMTTEYAARKNEECYSHVFILHHPDEEREACRPLRTGPAYDRQKALGAQFGQVNGWERPNYYGPKDAPETFRPRRAILSARRLVAICQGRGRGHPHRRRPDRRDGLHQAPRARAGGHRVSRSLHLQQAAQGGAHQPDLRADEPRHDAHGIHHRALGENEYYLVSAGAWTAYDADFLMKSAEDMGSGGGWVDIHDVTTQWGVFAIAGPKSRDVLREIVKDADPDTVLGNKRFPWLSMREIELGMCPVRAIRVAYTGELGWELHHPIEMQAYLWDQLMAAGEKHGMKLVGARAQNWLRQEKSYRAFGTELGRDATPLEAGLDRFVDLDKEFHGKAKMVETGVRFKCVTVLIDGPEDADPWGREGLFADGQKVGRLTSGGYSVAFGKQIGMGYVAPEHAEVGRKLKVRMFRELWDAEVVEDSPYDPTNAAIRVDG
jgi:dimethylglycine dehydrogenase